MHNIFINIDRGAFLISRYADAKRVVNEAYLKVKMPKKEFPFCFLSGRINNIYATVINT